jgi:hypothetical protein
MLRCQNILVPIKLMDGFKSIISELERMVKRHESLPGSCIRDAGYDAVATDVGSVSFKPP